MSFISTIKNAGRYSELMKVAVKYGFREFVYETKLHLLHSDGKKTLDHDGSDSGTSTMSRAVRMRMAMEELGPTFIKLGQILSTRPDILPDDWIEEFQKLQSEVPAEPWEKIHAQLIDELGDLDAKFQSIEEEPLAAASMGQAHRAIRKDGQAIVLKVLRPGIEKTINSDMEILEGIAHWLAKHHDDLPFDPVAVVDEFAGSIKNELDFMHEGRNTDAFREGLEEVFPLATLSLFSALKVDPSLNNLVVGESVLNDAVALITFRAITHYGVNLKNEVESIILSFVMAGLGSAAIGSVVGGIAALSFKVMGMGRRGDLPHIECTIFIAFAYFSFICAELPENSGIVSALFAGMTMRAFASPNLSPRSRLYVEVVLKVMTTICDNIIYLLVGFALTVVSDQ